MATQEQLEQVRANKVDALKGKVNSFIFWQKLRFFVCSVVAIVGSIAAQLLVRWWSG